MPTVLVPVAFTAQLLAGVSSLVVAFVLMLRSGGSRATLLLAAFLVALGCQIAMLGLWWAGVRLPFEPLTLSLSLMLGPLLFAHARAVLPPESPPDGSLLIHCLPSALVLVEAPLLGGLGAGVATVLFHASFGGYLALTRIARTRKLHERPTAADAADRDRWVGALLRMAAIVLVADVACYWSKSYGSPSLFDAAGALVFLTLVALVARCVRELLANPGLFGPGVPAFAGAGNVPVRVVSSGWKGRATVDSGRLIDILGRERLYTDPDLTVDRLADRMGVSSRALSEMVNRHLGRSVPELVNSFRIAEAKRLLADPARRDNRILDLLYEVGFNSKSTFNDAFKRATGEAPSAYRSRVLRRGGAIDR